MAGKAKRKRPSRQRLAFFHFHLQHCPLSVPSLSEMNHRHRQLWSSSYTTNSPRILSLLPQFYHLPLGAILFLRVPGLESGYRTPRLHSLTGISEKTVHLNPPVQTLSRKSSKQAKRKSVDIPRTIAMADSFATQVSSTGVAASIEGKESGLMVKATNLQIIQFDEAFIDFWSGSLFDPITSKRSTFIICKFKSTLEFPYKSFPSFRLKFDNDILIMLVTSLRTDMVLPSHHVILC